jgi:type IV pilus assembly protein PilB
LPDAVIRLGYATAEEVWRALADHYGLTFVDLAGVVVPPAIVELLPESVARENVCLPLAETAGALTVALGEPEGLVDTGQQGGGNTPCITAAPARGLPSNS